MNVESSRVNFSPGLGLICVTTPHSPWKSPLIPKVLFLNMVAKIHTNHYSVSQFTIQVYIKRQKKCFRLSKNNEVLKPVRLGISKRLLTCFFFFFLNLSPKLRCEGFELLIQCLMLKGQSKSAVSVILSPSPALTGSTFPKTTWYHCHLNPSLQRKGT